MFFIVRTTYFCRVRCLFLASIYYSLKRLLSYVFVNSLHPMAKYPTYPVGLASASVTVAQNQSEGRPQNCVIEQIAHTTSSLISWPLTSSSHPSVHCAQNGSRGTVTGYPPPYLHLNNIILLSTSIYLYSPCLIKTGAYFFSIPFQRKHYAESNHPMLKFKHPIVTLPQKWCTLLRRTQVEIVIVPDVI